MDPSYDNSFGSFSSGGNGGNQPVANAGNQPVNPVQPAGVVTGTANPIQPNPQPVSPVQQPMTNPMTNPVVPAQTGDIILQKPEKKGLNKKLIAIVSIALLFIIVALIAVLLMRQNGFFDSKLSKTFNEYANYLLYGKDSRRNIGQFEGLDYSYYFDDEDLVFSDDEQETNDINAYYQLLEDKLSAFVDFEAGNISDETQDLINEYKDAAFSFFQMKRISDLDANDIKKSYLENGYDNTKEYIENSYSVLVDSDYAIARSYGDFLIQTGFYYLNQFNAYHQVGCTDGISINISCSVVVTFDNDVGILELESAVKNIRNNTRNKVLEGCFEINEKIH